jgi:hypothetical protein
MNKKAEEKKIKNFIDESLRKISDHSSQEKNILSCLSSLCQSKPGEIK